MTALPTFPRAPRPRSRAVAEGSVYARVPSLARALCAACRAYAVRLDYAPERGYTLALYCACCADNHAHAVAP